MFSIWYNARAEVVLNRLLQKANVLSPDLTTEGSVADEHVPVLTLCVTFWNKACLRHGSGSALGSCFHLSDGSLLWRPTLGAEWFCLTRSR